MTRVLGRVGLTAALVVGGTVVATPPPVQAASGGSILLVGTMQTGPGMSYPCMEDWNWDGPEMPRIDVAKCAGPLASMPNTAGATMTATGQMANAGSWAGVNLIGVEAGFVSVTASGVVTGACEVNTGVVTGSVLPTTSIGTTYRHRYFTLSWTTVGGLAVVRGSTNAGEVLFGTLHMWPSGGSCLNKNYKSFTFAGPLFLANSQADVPPVILPPLPGGGPAGPSNNCTSGTIHEGTTAGVFTRVRVQAVDARTTWVCVRVASGGSGVGGQFVITAPLDAPTIGGMPRQDGLSGECTRPSIVPPPHPLAAGQIGDPSSPPHVPYLIDSYASPSEAWVCLQAGTTNVRVIVPLGAPSAGGLPSVAFNADPGTPDPL